MHALCKFHLGVLWNLYDSNAGQLCYVINLVLHLPRKDRGFEYSSPHLTSLKIPFSTLQLLKWWQIKSLTQTLRTWSRHLKKVWESADMKFSNETALSTETLQLVRVIQCSYTTFFLIIMVKSIDRREEMSTPYISIPRQISMFSVGIYALAVWQTSALSLAVLCTICRIQLSLLVLWAFI